MLNYGLFYLFVLSIGWQQNNRSQTSPLELQRGYPAIPLSIPNLSPILRLQQGWSWKGWEQEFLWRSCHFALQPLPCPLSSTKGKKRDLLPPCFEIYWGYTRRLLNALLSDSAEISKVMLTRNIQRKWQHWKQTALHTGKDVGEILFKHMWVSWEPDWSHLPKDLALKRFTTESLVGWKAQRSRSESLCC